MTTLQTYLTHVRELLSKATPGPWYVTKVISVEHWHEIQAIKWSGPTWSNEDGGTARTSKENALLIAASPALLSKLCKVVNAQAAEIKCLRSVLSEWDEDKRCYTQFILANDARDCVQAILEEV